MKDINNLIILYDYYGELLSPKQSKYFELYYFDNLSLSELSELLGVSRNAIHKVLRHTQDKLEEYEKVLRLKYKNDQIKDILQSIQDENIKNKIIKAMEE